MTDTWLATKVLIWWAGMWILFVMAISGCGGDKALSLSDQAVRDYCRIAVNCYYTTRDEIPHGNKDALAGVCILALKNTDAARWNCRTASSSCQDGELFWEPSCP